VIFCIHCIFAVRFSGEETTPQSRNLSVVKKKAYKIVNGCEFVKGCMVQQTSSTSIRIFFVDFEGAIAELEAELETVKRLVKVTAGCAKLRTSYQGVFRK